MAVKFFKFVFLVITVAFTAFFIFIIFQQTSFYSLNTFSGQNASTSTSSFHPKADFSSEVSITPENHLKNGELQKSSDFIAPIIKSKASEPISQKAVSSKSFEELINSSIVQLYCGNFNAEETSFSDIARGTGIIIDDKGEVLTNKHIIYNENSGKLRQNCFILKNSFPDAKSQKPKIYYIAEIVNYPLKEEFNDFFSKDKYYNDFAVLKIISKPNSNSKANFLLGFDYALLEDYSVLESGPNKYNYLPIDWDYQPKNDDVLITLGYGVDAAHNANQLTSTIGKLSGNINIDKNGDPEIILVESNATAGFSGGALINPKSKGLIGLISWITAGDVTGKYTVAIFRDFLRNLMLKDLNFDLKLIHN